MSEKRIYRARNICIGLIDGVTIPLVLSAVLSQQVTKSSIIFLSCLAVALAGSITMSASSYIEGKKYEADYFSFSSALSIGASYLTGGLLIALPYIAFDTVRFAFIAGALMASAILLVCGYIDSSLHQRSGAAGALRTWLVAMAATAAVYLVAGMV